MATMIPTEARRSSTSQLRTLWTSTAGPPMQPGGKVRCKG
jgi:hypothetical protein